MTDQKIQFDFVGNDAGLQSAASAISGALTGVQTAASKASTGLAGIAKASNSAADVWKKQRGDIEQTYDAMGKVPSKEITAQLDQIEKKFLQLGASAQKGNQLAADSMRKLLSEAKQVASSDALKTAVPSQGPTGTMGQFASIKSALSGGVGEANSALGSLMSVVGAAKGVLLGFAAVLAGGKMFKESVQATVAYTGEIAGLAKQLSISTEKASTLNIALKLTGGSSEGYADSVSFLNRKVRENEEALNKMGVQTRAANGEYLNQQQILNSALTVMGSYKEGTDRNLASQALFGKGADEATKLLKLNSETMARADELAKAYGLTVGTQNVAATKAYKEAIAEVKLAFSGIENAIGNAVLPILGKLGKWFSDDAPPVIGAFISIIQAVGDVVGTLAGIFGDLWDAVSSVFTSLRDAIAAVWSDVFQSFGVDIPKTFDLFKELLNGVKAAAIGFRVVLSTVFEAISAAVRALIENISTFARVAIAAFHLDWDGVKAAITQNTANVERIVSDSIGRIKKMATDADAQLAALDKAPKGEEPKKPAGGKSFVDPTAKKGGAESRVSQWENELNQQKLAHERMNAENGTFIEFSKEQERDFWKAKLDTVKMSNAERYSVEAKYLAATTAINKTAFEARIAQQKAAISELDKNYAAQLVIADDIMAQMARAYGEDSKQFAVAQKAKADIQKRYNEQQRQLADLATADTRAQAQADIDAQRELSQLKLNLGLATQLETLEQERAYQQQLYELERKAIEDRLALVDPDRDPVTHQQLLNQLLEQDRKYALEKQKLEGKITVEKAAPTKSVFDTFEQSFAKSATSILTRASTLREGLNAIWKEVGAAFVSEMVTKPIAQFAAGIARKLALGEAEAATETATAAATATTKIGLSSSTAMVEGTNNAVVAGTGAMSALAGIPIIGPALAAAGGPAMLAMALGLLGTVAFAREGFDVPAGMNPLTQLHQKEMVLPAQYADVIRGLAGQGAGGSAGDTHQHNYYISTMDARGVRQFVQRNTDAFADGGRKIARTYRNR